MKNLLVVLTVLLLFSCSNDTNNNNEPNQNVRLRIVRAENSEGKFQNFIYDENDLLIEENNDENRKTTYQYLNGLTISKQYSANNISYFTHTGNLITYSHNDLTNLTTTDGNYYKYNSDEKLIEEKRVSSGKNYITTCEYDKKGNMVKIIDNNGKIDTYEYDNNPRITLTTFPKDYRKLGWGGCSVNNTIKITKSNGSIITYKYTYNEYGYPKTIIVNDGSS